MATFYLSLSPKEVFFEDLHSALILKVGEIKEVLGTMIGENIQTALRLGRLVYRTADEYSAYLAELYKTNYSTPLQQLVDSIIDISQNGNGVFTPDTTLPTNPGTDTDNPGGLTPTGVIPGWYTRVNVDEFGRVLDGENPGFTIPARFVVKVPLSGVINGINNIFNIPNIPFANSEMIFRNGVLQGVGVDYNISGQTITFINPPRSNSLLVASYITNT